MPFNTNLPAENTDPWYTPLVNAWESLKTFVNGLETAISTKAEAQDLTDFETAAQGQFNDLSDVVATKASAADVAGLTATVGQIQDDLDNTFQLANSKATALNGLTGVWIGTQAQYDAITTPSDTVFYAITDPVI